MTARENGNNKKKQLVIMPGKEIREKFTKKITRVGSERTRVTDLWAAYSKEPIHLLFHSFNIIFIKHLLWVRPPRGWCLCGEQGSPSQG